MDAETDQCAQCAHTRGQHVGKEGECRQSYVQFTEPNQRLTKEQQEQCLCRRFK